MAVVPGPVEFLMGSPGSEKNRYSSESLHRVRIGRSFAIAIKEVTVGQFERFLGENSALRWSWPRSPEKALPQGYVNWYFAASYCRWLSEKEGMPDDQMCFPAIDQIREGMRLPADYLSRRGYRLPTGAEWQYACRAGALTSRYYGEADDLLSEYGWHKGNSQDRSWPVGSLKPNDLGLFDMLGNVWEWCHSYSHMEVGTRGRPQDDLKDPLNDIGAAGGCAGAYAMPSRALRAAWRTPLRRDDYGSTYGFRVARTCP
jgi:formylglycine-generating enzyme required for sulfatase activity